MIEPMLTEPWRGRATAVSCRAASRTSRKAYPHAHAQSCSAHIGGANLKSRATRDSPVLPPSPTEVPAPSGQRRCRMHPEHCHKLHAEAIRGCNLDQIAAITMVAHTHASGGGVPDACLLLPAGRVHSVCMA